MRIAGTILVCLAASGLMSPTAGALSVPSSVPMERKMTPQEQIYHEFLQATSDLWFLLSGIRDRNDADGSSARFAELVNRICLLDERLSRTSTETGLTTEVEAAVQEDEAAALAAGMLDTLQLKILEAFEDINGEFLSLCRVNCYGSERLIHAFAEASATGMFPEEALALLSARGAPMNDMESEEELVRLKHLEEPDRAVLDILQQVKDAASAQKAASALAQISRRLHNLIPAQDSPPRAVAAGYAAPVRAAFEPLSPLLWGIRTELVRIAALPGYETESYDSFSDALNSVYADLDATHSEYFDDVFDASFRADIDDALQENTSSTEH